MFDPVPTSRAIDLIENPMAAAAVIAEESTGVPSGTPDQSPLRKSARFKAPSAGALQSIASEADFEHVENSGVLRKSPVVPGPEHLLPEPEDVAVSPDVGETKTNPDDIFIRSARVTKWKSRP